MTEVGKKKRVPKEPLVARDRLGQEMSVDQVVVASLTATSIVTGRIKKIMPKTVEIKTIDWGKGRSYRTLQRHHGECIMINMPATTFYVLGRESNG